jgi:hypothetical protein
MSVDRTDMGRGRPARETDWERSERKSVRIALAIALVPIPVSLLISWALGSPPWRARPSTAHEVVDRAPADHGGTVPLGAHGPR